jgi:hypothetical protein
MHAYYYRPGKNAATALVSGMLALFSAKMWWDDGGIFTMIGCLFFGAAALKGAFNALNPEPAIKFDNQRLWVRTAFGSQSVTWDKVYGIALQVMTVRYWGIIPIGRNETLCVACAGGSFGARRLRVPAASIELPAGGAPALVQILREAQLAAVGPSRVAMAGAGQHGWGVPSKPGVERGEPAESGFDADAAIARYLASKESAQQPAAHAQAPGAIPGRPVFGRRQA